MQDKEVYINKILQDIFSLNSPAIDKLAENKLLNFIKSTINGDIPKEYFTINANLVNGEEGAVVYIITDTRLIKIDISIKGEAESSSFLLSSIINIQRKLLDNERAETQILFQNNSFGLRYQSSDIKVSNFFQELDSMRVKKG